MRLVIGSVCDPCTIKPMLWIINNECSMVLYTESELMDRHYTSLSCLFVSTMLSENVL